MVDSKEKIGRGEKQRSRGIERVEEKNSDKKKEEKEGEWEEARQKRRER